MSHILNWTSCWGKYSTLLATGVKIDIDTWNCVLLRENWKLRTGATLSSATKGYRKATWEKRVPWCIVSGNRINFLFDDFFYQMSHKARIKIQNRYLLFNKIALFCNSFNSLGVATTCTKFRVVLPVKKNVYYSSAITHRALFYYH